MRQTLGFALLIAAVTLGLAGCSSAEPAAQAQDTESAGGAAVDLSGYQLQQTFDTSTIAVTSEATDSRNGRLLKEHTCEGENTSPPLKWEGVPPAAKSLALVFNSPHSNEDDESQQVKALWVVYSIPTDVTGLPAGQPATEVLDIGAKQGLNGIDEGAGYSGPCPTPTIVYSGGGVNRIPTEPAQEQMYVARLYALDTKVDLAPGASLGALLAEIDGHIVAAGELALPYKSRLKKVLPGKVSTF